MVVGHFGVSLGTHISLPRGIDAVERRQRGVVGLTDENTAAMDGDAIAVLGTP
jgi:hypothetical protein